MLNLILGRAGTGKTNYIMSEIKRRMSEGETGMLLIVPEQYSHDAERQLCRTCGDRLSLHAETLSFTRLCINVMAETGRASGKMLDASGQILALHRAMESVAASLKAFGLKRTRTEILEGLLDAVKEFKSYKITPAILEKAASMTQNPLTDKLNDLSLIYSAYDALLEIHGNDAAERLTILAELIAESSIGSNGHIYFDGFNDFTAQELKIIEELMRKKAHMTICLTCDLDDNSEVFEVPRKTVTGLQMLASKYNIKVASNENKEYLTTLKSTLPQAPELLYMEEQLFNDSPEKYNQPCDAISLLLAPSRYSECEYAAYKVIELVKSGYRWRDIGVMARNWEDYGAICENIFEKYDIPYFSSGKTDILSKPPIALIDAALEIVTFGYEYKSIFRYLKTGLVDISTDDSAILENYAIKWQVRGTIWNRRWTMPPGGYNSSNEDDLEILEKLNKLREKIVKPLVKLRDNIKGESEVQSKLIALYTFFEDMDLQGTLKKKAEIFAQQNNKRLADEYLQMWDIIISAMEQMYSILDTKKMSSSDFHKLFSLSISQNDIGVIPVSLDRTPLGSMSMSRRRDLKCLIILGATDENMPSLGKRSGALSENERTLLGNLGADIPFGLEERLNREMNMLYSVLTLPSEKLFVIYSPENGQRPSFIVKRLREMFNITEESISPETYMTAAKKPYMELQYKYDSLKNGLSFLSMARQGQLLSKRAAKLIYGDNIALSATGLSSYYSCPYMHFLKNGLRLTPRRQAEFDALTAGSFIHFVLDGVFKEIKQNKGFKDTDEETCITLTEKYIEIYINDILINFEGKTTRFKYLFERYRRDVRFVVSDMLAELKNSSFEPLELEFDIGSLTKTQKGIVDRIDGFEHDGKLYLRVIDYKTARAAYTFDMTDILAGRDLQMLLYLFALKKYGFYGNFKNIEAAGVLYVPARDVIINAPRDADAEEIQKKRKTEMKRSGLILNNPAILEAMESGNEKNYLPVKQNKEGGFTGNCLITAQQFELLSNHVENKIHSAAENIKNGKNECSPYFKNENDNACYFCDYHSVCGFDEETGDRRRFISKIKDDEAWEMLEATENQGNTND